MMSIKEQEFMRLVEFVKNNFGINLMQKRVLIEGRLSHIISEKGFDNFQSYLDYAFSENTGSEVKFLIDRLTTNHTYFMREVSHFDFLRDQVLPYLEDVVQDKDLRIWSAGCSTGEEPYTLSMIIAEYFKESKILWDAKILATDISSKVLKFAEEGIYSAEEVESLPANWKLNYFIKIDKENYQIKENIRKEIIFRGFNLMEPRFPFRKKFHVIFCRNVMIYFEPDTKADLVQRFYDMTEPGGYLFIGHSESLDRRLTPYKYISPSVYRKG